MGERRILKMSLSEIDYMHEIFRIPIHLRGVKEVNIEGASGFPKGKFF